MLTQVLTRAPISLTLPQLWKYKTRRFQRVSEERMAGLEPATFCMASRCSSQLSYIREGGKYSRLDPVPSSGRTD